MSEPTEESNKQPDLDKTTSDLIETMSKASQVVRWVCYDDELLQQMKREYTEYLFRMADPSNDNPDEVLEFNIDPKEFLLEPLFDEETERYLKALSNRSSSDAAKGKRNPKSLMDLDLWIIDDE